MVFFSKNTINSNHCRPTRQYSYLYCCNWFLHILRISNKHYWDSRLNLKLSSFCSVRTQIPFNNQKKSNHRKTLSQKMENRKIWKSGNMKIEVLWLRGNDFIEVPYSRGGYRVRGRGHTKQHQRTKGSPEEFEQNKGPNHLWLRPWYYGGVNGILTHGTRKRKTDFISVGLFAFSITKLEGRDPPALILIFVKLPGVKKTGQQI